MKLSPEDVLRLGSLSRISIADTDLPQLTADLNHILEFAAVLGEIDPALPEYGFDAGGNILRDDKAAEPLGQAAALEQAPAAQDGFFRVPRTVDSGGHGS